MKRTLLSAVLLLALAAPALALEALPTSNKPRTLRVAVVNDDDRDVFSAGIILNNARSLERGNGNLFGMLREQGAQVDFFNSKWFLKSTNMTNSEATLWKTLGNTYGLVIVNSGIAAGTKTAGATNKTRFLHADSTNANLLILPPGYDSGGSDSSYAGCVIAAGYGTAGTTSSGSVTLGSRMAYRPYGTTDTLWVALARLPVMALGVNASIASVVRLLEPLQLTANHPLMGLADSTHTTVPTLGDSTAAGHEILGMCFRVYFTSGRYTDWFAGVQGSSNAEHWYNNLGMYPYAMAARYLALKPIKASVELDDFFDPSPNNTGRRWTNAGVDSLLARWKTNYGCQPVIDVNPLHAYEYMRGDDPTYEMAWTGDAWSWPRRWKSPWVHHSHDSSVARPTSGLVGRFGGYQTGNGIAQSSGDTAWYSFHRMRAFQFNPGNADPELRYGIYQRLLYSDSLRRIVCPECPVPPYLSFPDNAVLPVNHKWHAGLVSRAYFWNYRTKRGVDSLCTVDSLFLAMGRGLRIPSGGTLYLRGTLYNGTGTAGPSTNAFKWWPWGFGSIKNYYSGANKNDTLPAHTPFLYPGERKLIRDPNGASDVTGAGTPYTISVVNVGSVLYDNTTYQDSRYTSTPTLCRLLGFGFGAQDGGGVGPVNASGNLYGTAHSADPQHVYGSGAEYFPYTRDRPRIIYFHPSSNYTAGTANGPAGPGDSQSTAQFERGILRPVRALNTMAGYQIIKWVWPWEVYSK